MLASFIIPFHSARIDNLLQTIRFLEENHKSVIASSELLLMCQDRCGQIQTQFQSTRLYNMKYDRIRKCQLLNEAIRFSEADKIVFLDSDRVLPPEYFSSVLSQLQPKTAVTTLKMWRLTRSGE